MPRGGFSACRSGGGGPEEEGPDGHGHGDHDELEKVGVFVEVLRALARVAFAAVRRLGRLPAWQRRLFGGQLGSFSAPLDTEAFWCTACYIRAGMPLGVAEEIETILRETLQRRDEKRRWQPSFTVC